MTLDELLVASKLNQNYDSESLSEHIQENSLDVAMTHQGYDRVSYAEYDNEKSPAHGRQVVAQLRCSPSFALAERLPEDSVIRKADQLYDIEALAVAEGISL